MKNLRLLILAVVLTVGLGLLTPVLAQTSCNPGEIQSPPGETHGPPCASAQAVSDDITDPGIIHSPPPANSVDLITVVEVALIELLILW